MKNRDVIKESRKLGVSAKLDEPLPAPCGCRVLHFPIRVVLHRCDAKIAHLSANRAVMEMADGQEHEFWYCPVRDAFGGTEYGPHQPEDPPCECNTPRLNPAEFVALDDTAATATRDCFDDDDDSMSSCN